jgi:nitronate monooxygenase
MALELEQKGATIEEMMPLIAGTRGQSMLQHGKVDEGIMSVGQCIGLIENIPTVKEVIDKIIADAGKIINDRLVPLARN